MSVRILTNPFQCSRISETMAEITRPRESCPIYQRISEQIKIIPLASFAKTLSGAKNRKRTSTDYRRIRIKSKKKEYRKNIETIHTMCDCARLEENLRRENLQENCCQVSWSGLVSVFRLAIQMNVDSWVNARPAKNAFDLSQLSHTWFNSSTSGRVSPGSASGLFSFFLLTWHMTVLPRLLGNKIKKETILC